MANPFIKVNFKTWVKNDLVTAADLNEQVRDNGNAIWYSWYHDDDFPQAQGDMHFYGDKDYMEDVGNFDNTGSGNGEIGDKGKILRSDGYTPGWYNHICRADLYPTAIAPADESFVNFDPYGSGDETTKIYQDGANYFWDYEGWALVYGIYLVTETVTCKNNGHAGSIWYYTASDLSYEWSIYYFRNINDTDDINISITYPAYCRWMFPQPSITQNTGYDMTIENWTVRQHLICGFDL